MTAGFTDVHDDLRAVARDILAGCGRGGAGGVGGAGGAVGAGGTGGAGGAGEAGPVPVDFRRLADAGWLGLEVPEALDGAGATLAETAIVLQEIGRAAAATSYLGSGVLAVGALNLVEPGPGRDDLLRRVAAGLVKTAVVMPVTEEALDVSSAMSLERYAGGWRLQGEAVLVPDAGEADRLLVVARAREQELVLVDLAAGQPDLEVQARPVLDATRRFAAVSARGVTVSDGSVWRLTGDSGAGAGRLVDRGALAVACDSLGLAEAMLEATVSYVQGRHQFGRPVGSFQAVKHACADMLVKISVSRQLVASAVDAVAVGDTGEAGGGVAGAWVAVSQAKSYTCEAAVEVAGKAMQLHGGIGYTWESGIHVYLKRAALNRSLFGSARAHRRRLGARFM